MVDDTALHLNALDKQYVQREKSLPEKITKTVNNSSIVPLPSTRKEDIPTDSREGNVKNIGAGALSIIQGGRENGTSLSRAPEQMSKIINAVTDLRSEDSMSYTSMFSKRPINIDLTNRDDLNIASLTPGHTQVTDMSSSPYPVINQIRGTSNTILFCSTSGC